MYNPYIFLLIMPPFIHSIIFLLTYPIISSLMLCCTLIQACGAACAALSHCLAGKHIPTCSELGADPFDYQQQYIVSELSKRIPNIVNPVRYINPNNPKVALNSSNGSKDEDISNDPNAIQVILTLFYMFNVRKPN